MLGPIWLNWFFASLMVLSALFHVGRLVSTGRVPAPSGGRAHGYDDDLTHLVMSALMAVMLVMRSGAHVATVWSVIIGVPTLWFILRTIGALTSRVRPETSDGGARAKELILPLQQVPMCASMLFMLVVAGGSASAAPASAAPSPAAPAAPAAVMDGMVMGAHASHVSPGVVTSISLVALTSLVLIGILSLVAVRHVRELKVAVVTQRAWPVHTGSNLRQLAGEMSLGQRAGGMSLRRRASGLVLAPGLSLGCQLAMSAAMIYMLILMV